MSILTFIIAVVLFMMLIAVHELGHFSMAKFFNINVYEYAIGMGPVLFQRKKGETMYSLRAIPLGGFCNLDDTESDPNAEDAGETIIKHSEDPGDFRNQPVWAKIPVLAAGSLFNILFAIILLGGVYFFYNGMKVSLLLCLKQAVLMIGVYVVSIVQWISGLFTGASSTDELTGVVGIVQVISESASYGIADLVYIMGILSINLGIMNMLPIPALDGGRILFTILRKLSGGRITEEAEMIVNGIGMILLLVLMVFLIFKDTFKLLS